jgi:murein L,D-transpeptidase YcbB/YkuD
MSVLVLLLLALPLALAASPGCQTPRVAREAETRVPLTPLAENVFKAQLDSLAPERGEDALIRRSVRAFYERRGYSLAWAGKGGEERADAFRAVLDGADREGLEPADYTIPGVAGESPALDLALTRTFIRFARDLSRGRVDPSRIDRNWRATPRELDLAAALEDAIRTGDFKAAAERLAPKHAAYAALRTELSRYRELAASGGWASVPDGPTLKPGIGAEPARLRALARRLEREGYLESDGESRGARYGPPLSGAVSAFQRRHGLDGDGVLGPRTLAALNVPVEARVRQIEINMERWRWLPNDMGDRHIFVNVPSFRLSLVERGRESLGMNVIVGKAGWSTPLFSDRMTHLILNPSWNVPHSIAVDEILPKLVQDPGYLKTKNFQVTRAGVPVDPATVDWPKVSARGFPYHLRQLPGPENPLGRVKFMFPNTFSVYLHDTPTGNLFRRSERAFSHGCIRIERPIDLAEHLLGPDPPWNRERILKAIASGSQQVISLRRAVPVYILYWTAFVNTEGAIEFHHDLYNADRHLDAALAASRPAGHAPRPRVTQKF